jgi:hypothetical protein
LRERLIDMLFHLAQDPTPPRAELSSTDIPMPGTVMLSLPADGATVTYVITPHEDAEVITVLHVSIEM